MHPPRSFWKSLASREQHWEVLVGLHSGKDTKGWNEGMKGQGEMARKSGTKHIPSSLLTHKWEQGLCVAIYMQGTEKEKQKHIVHTSFFPPGLLDGCIVVILLASSMLWKCVHY